MHEWRSRFQLQASLLVLVRNMIDLSVPFDEDQENPSKSRNRVMANFQEFYTQQGEWLHIFLKALPPSVSTEELENNNKSFSVKDAKEFVEKPKECMGVSSCLKYFLQMTRST